MLIAAIGPAAVLAQDESGADDVKISAGTSTRKFPPKDQPYPELYRQRRQVEKAVLEGDLAKAQSLAVTAEDKVLLLLLEFAGTDTITWEPGDIWDPYGVAEEVDAAELGDCTNVISQTQTFTFTPTLHNEVPIPPSADAAYKGSTADFSFTMWAPNFSPEYYDDMVFGDGVSYSYNAGNGDPVNIDVGPSMRQYYENLSGDTYTVDGDVIGWIPLPHSMPFYGADLCPGNLSFVPISGAGSDGWYNNGEGTSRVDYGTPQTAIMDAIDWINANMPGFPWADYDTNGDGRLDGILVVSAGVGEANNGANEHAVWPHSASVNYCVDPGPDGVCGTDDDIRTGRYIWQGETTGVSTFTHEFGHFLGADDLYAYGFGETSAGIWTDMADDRGHGVPWDSSSIGMDPWHKLGWGWLNPMIIDYDDPELEVMLTQASDPTEGVHDALLVRLPDQLEQLQEAYSGEYMLWGGRENLENNLVYRPVDLSGASSSELTFWHRYDIEEAWDFGFVQVSTDSGATWASLENENTTYDHDPNAIDYVVANLPGFTGHNDGWTQETFDLTAYAGQEIWLGFRYATDWATLENGWWVDDIEVTADGATVLFDDLESGAAPWTFDPEDGWSRSNGVFTYPHYYLFEWRNDVGVDHNLATGRCQVESWGMIAWYVNDQKYTANAIYDYLSGLPSFGPKGKALVVDSHPEPLRDPTSEYAHNARSNINSRCYGMRDAAFGLDELPSFYVTQPPYEPSRWGNPDFEYPAQAPVSAFHDSMSYYPGLEYTDIRSVNDPRGPLYFWSNKAWDASAVVPAGGAYGISPPEYDRSGFVQRIEDDDAWYGFWDWPAGTGNPGDTHVQYGIHVEVVDQAEDGSWGKLRFWNSMTEFQGGITQTSNTTPTVIGSTVDVEVEVTNIGGAVDAFFVLPIDPDTMYVMGSAYGGATPLTAAYAAQLAAERGLTDLANLAANAAPDDVVAIAYMGLVGTGEMLDFGFSAKVTSQSGSVHHSMAMFDGSHFFQDIHSDFMEIVDNDDYDVEHSMRYDADRDTYINGTQPTSFYGDAQTMWVGFYDEMRPLIHTPVSGIAPDAAIDEAYLYVYVLEGRGYTTWSNSMVNVDAHAVTTEWMPVAVNWWMPWNAPGGDFGPVVGTNQIGSGKIGTWVRFDVRDAVQDFVRSGENQGFILTSMAENLPVVRYAFATKEHYSGNVPYMRVMYRTPY
jgi:immune inhibitor A